MCGVAKWVSVESKGTALLMLPSRIERDLGDVELGSG
jgi:hypothetical protein